jgi:hypothetical protein
MMLSTEFRFGYFLSEFKITAVTYEDKLPDYLLLLSLLPSNKVLRKKVTGENWE